MRVPAVAMRLVRVGDACSEVGVAGHHSQPRQIEIGRLGVRTHCDHQITHQFLGAVIVGETRLHRTNPPHELLDFDIELRPLRIEITERLADQRTSPLDDRPRLGDPGLHVDVAPIDARPTGRLVQNTIYVHGDHESRG